MANSIDTNKRLRKTYNPVNAASVRRFDQARSREQRCCEGEAGGEGGGAGAGEAVEIKPVGSEPRRGFATCCTQSTPQPRLRLRERSEKPSYQAWYPAGSLRDQAMWPAAKMTTATTTINSIGRRPFFKLRRRDVQVKQVPEALTLRL
ncbi:hypothetical protein ABIE89_005981 [Bradyrhizobium niftali]|uniref:hypothetical protein n=1 Tax=Bradyrhizobium niftali TaxID=2560055 RepID=UPI003832B347